MPGTSPVRIFIIGVVGAFFNMADIKITCASVGLRESHAAAAAASCCFILIARVPSI